MIEAQKILMSQMTWPRPYQGRFVVRCDFHIEHYNMYMEFKIFAITNYEDA